MNPCQIWSPVILAELLAPCTVTAQCCFPLQEAYESLEDLKMKVLMASARHLGPIIDVEIKLQILYLLRDAMGLHLLSSEEIRKEKLKPQDFDRQDWLQGPANLVVSIDQLDYHGGLEDNTVQVDYTLGYMLRVTQEQAVPIGREINTTPENEEDWAAEMIRKLQAEILTVEGEKAALRRQLHQQEKNLSSLKHGVKKAEHKNLALIKEVESCYQMITALRQTLEKKDLQIQHFEKQNSFNTVNGMAGSEPDKNIKMGSLLKRIFQNNS